MKEPKEKPKVRLHFPQGGGVEPKGFSTAAVNDTVTVTLVGRVSEVRDRADEWDNGKTLQIQLKSCKIDGPRIKAQTIQGAVAKANAKRTL